MFGQVDIGQFVCLSIRQIICHFGLTGLPVKAAGWRIRNDLSRVISARDPQRVAAGLAELWKGVVLPFPPIALGSLIVMAGDDRNSAVEVYPAGTRLHPVDGDADAEGRAGAVEDTTSATHLALASPLSRDEVMALAKREGWLAKYRKRGDMFGVIELWLENTLMVEILTPEMQAEYLQTMTIEGWKQALAASAPA